MNQPNILTALKGLAMGMAEVVPGVSGGTIAFITNIYERLIADIKTISKIPVHVWKKDGFGAFWKHIDGTFLLALLAGMLVGIVIGVLGITYLLEQVPSLVWGFFFGLIIASAIYIARKIKSFGLYEIILLIAGICIAYTITVISPAQGSQALVFVFLSGMIAICALILPGISGSFILLLLGMYTIILHSAKDLLSNFNSSSFLLILVFLLGCLSGLALFANLLDYLFKKFHNPTLALLTGFMIGSLNRIWPWRNPVLWLDKTSGQYISILTPGADPDSFHIVKEMNVLPANYEGQALIFGVIIAFLSGLAIVWLLDRSDRSANFKA
ncbi:MAG: DUF368 domain-containing protein [Saprospiraceae bacterium]|nr:DUF368 domain-containing protein [Saprospiraceae bacterium]